MLAPQAHGKDLELMAWIDDDVPAMVSGDRGRLRQVLINLVANAVKFTEAGEVTVRVRTRAATRVRFDVTDTGIGISRNAIGQAVRLLRAGRHLDHAPLRRHRPRPGDLAPARRADGRRDRRRLDAGRGQHVHLHRAPRRADHAAPAPPRAPRAAGRAQVLVVDDNATNREIVEAYLRRARRDAARRAAAGAEALQRDARRGARRRAVRARRARRPDAGHGRHRARAGDRARALAARRAPGHAHLDDRPPRGRARGRHRPLPAEAGPPRAPARDGRRGAWATAVEPRRRSRRARGAGAPHAATRSSSSRTTRSTSA